MHTFIIAEAGVNHNGDIETAKKLVDVAADAGADAVKFQTFQAEKLVCKKAQKAGYQLQTTDGRETQYEMLKKLELTQKMHKELINYCNKKNIMFLSTPFDEESLYLLMQLQLHIIKIPSGEITNYPLLKAIAQTGKKVIMSTGMSTIEEIRQAVKVLKDNGSKEIILLHCNTQYPTPYCDVNLKAMQTIRSVTGCEVGYSDHTLGIEIPIAAVTLGATVIEKHFTLDRNMKGPDHKASLEPIELKNMVKAIRNVEIALGNEKKLVTNSEKENLVVARKSIVAMKKIHKGEIITNDSITTKRPGNGINPMRWNEIIGTQAIRDFEADELIEIGK